MATEMRKTKTLHALEAGHGTVCSQCREQMKSWERGVVSSDDIVIVTLENFPI